MLSKISPTSSATIDAMRFPVVLLVVFSHCVLIRANTPATLELSADNLFLATELLFRSFGGFAVAWFALISGYFFFSRTDYGVSAYATALSKRVSTLLIPYILWNALFILAVWGKNELATLIGFAPGIQPVEQALLANSSWLELFMLPINHPLWYVRELIYLALLSPLIYVLVRYLGAWALVPWGVLYLFPGYLPVSVPLSGSIGFYFVLGVVLRRLSFDLFDLSRRLRWLGYIGSIWYVVLVLFLNDIRYYGWSHALALIGLLIGLFNLFAWLRQHAPHFFECCGRLAPATFFVYALHAMVIINLVRGSLYASPLGVQPWGPIVIFFATGVLTSLISWVAYRLCSRFCPRLTQVLCGGRA